MEHLIVQALPSDQIAESSRTTSEVLANFLPNKSKRRKSNPSGWSASKIKKAKVEGEQQTLSISFKFLNTIYLK